ncbi:MAG: YggS family pyridoxal phosphate-dependent enzyme [Synechococcaceae bacterium WB4_2_0805]|nr:YggS family pyridoxal phosphate-dependent enzyme [Synechococcaceae bacterium WB4_2_0805]
MDSLVQRYGQLRRELPASVQLLAVSKGQPADAVRLLYELGQRSFGESRLQEAQEKQTLLADLVDIDWHFIGRLQTNKVRPVLARFSCLHSVDSLELAKRISRIALEEGHSPKLYAQVQLRLDPNKGGFQLEQLRQQWLQLQELPGVAWVGVMLIPPQDLGTDELAQIFKQGASLAAELQLPGSSMGMSNDWPLAVAAGSTLVRLGSGLFQQQSVTKNLQVHSGGAI